MNLWVKRTGQLLLTAVALFFLSCQDESSLTGFPNPNTKFNINYAEITLESSVYGIDSITTQNFSGSTTNRLLVGRYADPSFGTITTTGVTNIYPLSTALTATTVKYVYDSVYIELRFDFYNYGTAGTSTQTFSIHELTDTLSTKTLHYSKTPLPPYAVDPLGTGSFSVNATTFKSEFEDEVSEKDTVTLAIKLSQNFGERLFNLARQGGDAYDDDSTFISAIKGLAIVPDAANNKIVGFDHLNSLSSSGLLSRVVVHYHTLNPDDTPKDDSLKLNFAFGLVNYTRIETDRTSSELSGILDFYQDIDPGSFRYSQTGTGIVTKVDFNNFFTFVDQYPNMIINSAELAITGIEQPDNYPLINSFALRLLEPDNQYSKLTYVLPSPNATQFVPSLEDQEEINYYAGTLSDVGGFFSAMGDDGGYASLNLANEETYSTYISLFAQQLYLKPMERRHRYFGLYPVSPLIGKSLNRTVFNKNNLKLKIYYTIPTITE